MRATPEAFFQRCRDLRPAFFAEVFTRFTARVLTAVPPRYAAEMAEVQSRFPALVVLDGSRLAAIARRLKLLWDERAVVLPGCLLGVYDLGRGVCRALVFDADAAASEFKRALAALDTLARETLVLGDRLYCSAAFFAALHARGCWGVVRRNKQLRVRKVQRLRKRRVQGGCLEDWLVRAGSGQRVPPQTLRYIRWRRGGTRYEVLTNVLTPTRLSAEEALDLYPYRWGIERMFYDLKEVLNLNRIYAANPNAVAMQVYAAALVYNAMRVAQSEAAAQVGWRPRISRRPSSSPGSPWPVTCMCRNSTGRVSSAAGPALIPISCAAVAGRARRPRPSRSSPAPNIAGAAGSAPRAVTGNRSLMFAAGAASSPSYLSGDVAKAHASINRCRSQGSESLQAVQVFAVARGSRLGAGGACLSWDNVGGVGRRTGSLEVALQLRDGRGAEGRE